MTDARKRQRAREATLGTIQDEARFIAEQVRSGDLPENAVRLAAILGDAAALLAYPRPEFDQWKRWDRKQSTREADCTMSHHTHTMRYPLCSIIGYLDMPPWGSGLPPDIINNAYQLAYNRARLLDPRGGPDIEINFFDRQFERINRSWIAGHFSYIFHLFHDLWFGLQGENAVDEEYHRQRQDLINLLLGRI